MTGARSRLGRGVVAGGLARAAVAVTALAVLAGSVVTIAPAAEAAPSARRLGETGTLGLHVPGLSGGSLGTAPVAPVRLWDTGVAWAQVNTAKGVYDWTTLDRVVAGAESTGAPILYVLGLTPTWARSSGTDTDYLVPGSTSMPESLSVWKSWVTAVATRYRGRIEAYQIWNEANLSTFWTGTPQQMASLTKAANTIINRIDPDATVVAPSTTMRYGFERWYPTFLTALRAKGWPVDVFAGHFYPPSTGTPATRAEYIELFRETLLSAGAPNRPIWDTEVNYGIAGPGPAFPDKDIPNKKAAAFVAQTYLDSARLGVERAYWYSWLVETELLGITMQPGTGGATAFETVGGWLGNARWRGCGGLGPLRICRTGKGDSRSVIVYSAGPQVSWKVESGLRRSCDARGRCATARPGSRVMIGTMPVRYTP